MEGRGLVEGLGARRQILPPQELVCRLDRGLFDQGADALLGGGPFGPQRFDDHRADDLHDLVAVGIVGTQLAALVWVQPALEEGAKDGRIDL